MMNNKNTDFRGKVIYVIHTRNSERNVTKKKKCCRANIISYPESRQTKDTEGNFKAHVGST